MADIYTNCPNCKAPIKSGVFNSNIIVTDENKVKVINEFTESKSPAYCTTCVFNLQNQAKIAWSKLMEDAKKTFEKLLTIIPVVTLQNPKDWDYRVLRMVTAQSVTGTGVVSEISSSFSDFFGMQSNRLNSKLRNGENICKSALRMEAISLGGNAIIATDIDYAEVGGDKGMLMVCMSGTAIKLKNLDILEVVKPDNFAVLFAANAAIIHLEKFQAYFG